MRDVDLTAVRIDEARRVVVRGRVAGAAAPVLVARKRTSRSRSSMDDRKLVYLGFDLAGSNFPLQAAFPLFMSQSLEWLRPRGDDPLSNHMAAGSAHSIPVPAGETPGDRARAVRTQPRRWR